MNTLQAGAGSDTLASAISALADGWTAPKTACFLPETRFRQFSAVHRIAQKC
jgi:hypothetical protein